MIMRLRYSIGSFFLRMADRLRAAADKYERRHADAEIEKSIKQAEDLRRRKGRA